jgi:Kdo2-lipid IVA lauroyltransferase/acyltransferase
MWLVKFFSRLIHLIPLRVHWWLGCLLGWIWWISGLRRFTLYRNITIAFPDLPLEEKRRVIRTSLSHLGFTFIEVLHIPSINKKWVDKNVVFHGVENYDRARAQGNGVLFLSLHLANGDLGATALSLRGTPFYLISKRFKSQKLNDIWWNIRAEKGTRFIDAHNPKNAFQITKALRSNFDVCFVLDQFMSKPYGILTKFFGRSTGTAYGLALFAAKTKAPVVPVYAYRTPDLKTHVVFEPEVEPISEADRDLQIALMTQKYNEVLEGIIRRHPEQWMWVHRRWKRWG